MMTRTSIKSIALILLFNFSTAGSALALSSVRILNAETYQKTHAAYVGDDSRVVEVQCEAGDTLISGDCEGAPKAVFTGEPEYRLNLTSAVSEKDANTWSCKAQKVPRLQVVLLKSLAICKRSQVPTQARFEFH
jgi:Tfp pilus assembly protein PilX